MGNCFSSEGREDGLSYNKWVPSLSTRSNSDRPTSEATKAPTSNIIIPLYIYPDPGAWQDLHESIRTLPDVQFTVIINPGNGPGPDDLPDANYLDAIPKLTSYANVEVLGYVHVTYARRPFAQVIRDVEKYSAWADRQTEYPGLSVSGIFVDETPFSLNKEAEMYLGDLTKFAKSRSGFGPNKTVVHNPGCVPARASSLALADLTIVFEDTYRVFKSRLSSGVLDLQRVFHDSTNGIGEYTDELKHLDRSKLGLMIHSVPHDTPESELREVMQRARALAGSIFVTDSRTQIYERFSERWKDWVIMIGAT